MGEPRQRLWYTQARMSPGFAAAVSHALQQPLPALPVASMYPPPSPRYERKVANQIQTLPTLETGTPCGDKRYSMYDVIRVPAE